MNILLLCTYPINDPKHGGQLRVRNIVDAYRAAGHDVEIAGVLGSAQYGREDGFVSIPNFGKSMPDISNISFMEDYAIGCLFAEDDFHYQSLAKLIRKTPDLIHIEQPWLFRFAQRFNSLNQSKAKLFYGSQNIEWLLKRQILSSAYDLQTANIHTDLIMQVELNAIKTADAIACVSQSDVDWVKLHTNKQVILAPNGVVPWDTSDTGRKEAINITSNYNYSLYCASAHPPNMTGFFDIFGGGFGSLKPDEKLVVAGSAGFAIQADARVHQSAKLAEKVVVAGVVSQPCLEGLLDAAQCIVLPITQGGGTNLKTAEALWSGKHIVATTIAMRGFEKFIGTSGVYVADNSTDFKVALRSGMEADELVLSSAELEMRRAVLWESCLKSLVGFMDMIAKKVNA